MANTGPFWTDNIAVQAPYGLLKGGCLRATFDLQSAFGAVLKIGVGRYATGALNAGLDVLIRRVLNDGGAAHQYPATVAPFATDLSYGNQLINNAANYAAGASSIGFDSQAGTAFAHGDFLCFWGQTSIPAASGPLSFASGVNMELLRCSSGAATPLIPDSPTKYAHNDNEFFTLANAWEVRLDGGSVYELIFDAGGVTTSSAVFAVMADMQRFDKLIKVA
ncbi:MAG: hypothetical protein ABFC96_07750 [Thermoguttaceae bacterium]